MPWQHNVVATEHKCLGFVLVESKFYLLGIRIPLVTVDVTVSEDCGMSRRPMHITEFSRFPFQLSPGRSRDKNPLCQWHGVSSQGVDDSKPHRRATLIRHVLHSWILRTSVTVYQPVG